MPLVILKVDDALMSFPTKREFAQSLLNIVAGALNSVVDEGGQLTADDIEVWGRDVHPLDTNTMPIEILIFCGDYPSRATNIKDREWLIEERIRKLYPVIKGKGFVWILPQQNEAFGFL
jgi:hypothetical protein